MNLSVLLPRRIGNQLVLLNSIALALAFSIAVAMVGIGKLYLDQSTQDQLVVERILDLSETLGVIDSASYAKFARAASSRTTSVKIASDPSLNEIGDDTRSENIASALSDLGFSDVRAVVLPRAADDALGDARTAGRNHEVILVSLPLESNLWLNFSGRSPQTWFTSVQERFLLFIFAVTFVLMTVAVLFVVRRIVRPVRHLADAAKKIAGGERNVQLSFDGARELTDANRAFDLMQTEIRQFEQQRNLTMAAVGHDLRTPITSLRIRAELIEDQELADAMIKTLDEMTDMADGLITFARSGQVDPHKESFDFGVMLQELCTATGASFEAHSNVFVNGSQNSLRRAFRNLIENAKRYGGSASVVLKTEESQAKVDVLDHGPGIAPELFEDIFEPFRRGEASRNNELGGAGLGLSISREILRSHGGDLSLQNRPEGGLRASASVLLDLGSNDQI